MMTLEPEELIKARRLLSSYDKDNINVNTLDEALNHLHSVIEGEFDVKWVKIAENIVNLYKHKIIVEANVLLSDDASIILHKLKNLRERIQIFIDTGFDPNASLQSLIKELATMSIKIKYGVSTEVIDDFNRALKEFGFGVLE
ncbi:MAG: hypothetical protein WBW55_04105 [Desulfobaccales bacterium]